MYVVVWEFKVKENRTQDFESVYGIDGAWVRLFNSAPGYVETQLLRDARIKNRYLTVDYWLSEEQYDRFRQANSAEYDRIDSRCAGLTEDEHFLGACHIVGREALS